MLTATRLGVNFTLATPPSFGPSPDIVTQAEALAAASGATLTVTHSPTEAVAGAQAVYTDVWTSMGHEAEAERRRQAFRHYQVGEALFAQAAPEAVFMHCLPAKRDEEVTDAVIESARSVVFDQAENRLHTQKALLLMMVE
jgi:ornithine carbamoyltransferase